jgi:hypothetical protein
MKKQTKKLQLNRETLTLLETDLRQVEGGVGAKTGESVCWCYT